MKIWTDNKGRQWRVSVTVATIKRVRDLTGIDLMGICDGTLVAKLAGDPIALVDVLYAVVHPQAMENKVDDNEFADGIGGDCIQAGLDALMTELIDFFPAPKKSVFARVWEGLKQVEAKAVNQAMSKVETTLENLMEGTNQA